MWRQPNTHLCSITFFLIEIENRTFYEIMWNNTVQPDRQQMTIWRMRTACWISEATKTYSEYVIVIDFPLGYAVAQLVEALRYKSEGRGFDSPMVSLEFFIDIILPAAL